MSNATYAFAASIITENKWAGGIFPTRDGGIKACIGDFLDFPSMRRDIEAGRDLPSGETIVDEMADAGWGFADGSDDDVEVELDRVVELAQAVLDAFAAEVAEEMEEGACLDLDFLTDGEDGFYYYRADELGCEARVPADEVDGSEFADYDDFCQSTTCEVLRDGEWVAHEGC